jgi:nitrate reductase molybdenum cofactor assembly chaperone NarJ/NarW
VKWLRNRRSAPAVDGRVLADTWQLVSLLLDYPDEALVERGDLLRSVTAALPPRQGEPLTAYLDALERTPLGELQADYVDTFDVTRKCSLHLTYFTHGDTRKRGVALVEFRQAYRRAGVEFDIDTELPDHLCVLLEFGASHDGETAWALLNRHRVGIELLRMALAARESPWLPVVDALRSTLPDLGPDDHVALAKLVAAGPPKEEVGLDTSPYAVDPRLSEHVNPRPEPLDLPPYAPPTNTTEHLGTTIPVGGPR